MRSIATENDAEEDIVIITAPRGAAFRQWQIESAPIWSPHTFFKNILQGSNWTPL